MFLDIFLLAYVVIAYYAWQAKHQEIALAAGYYLARAYSLLLLGLQYGLAGAYIALRMTR